MQNLSPPCSFRIYRTALNILYLLNTVPSADSVQSGSSAGT